MAKNGFQVFDSDLHICEPCNLWQSYMDPELRKHAPVGAPTTGSFSDMNLLHEGTFVNRHGSPQEWDDEIAMDAAIRHQRVELYEDYERRGWDGQVQLDAMDREGIDLAVLYPSRGLAANGKEYKDDRVANAVVRAYNDWLYDFCQADSKRLFGAAMVLPQDVNATVDEIRRAVSELGFKAIYIRPNPVRGRNWHDPVYDPIWSVCEALGILVGFHEGLPCTLPYAVAERFDGRHEDLWMTDHVVRHPAEMMYASLCMIAGGVLERFPELRVAFLEANCSWTPYFMWRMDEHFEAREKIARKKLSKLPSEYFRERCYVSIDADEETAADAIERLGDNIVFSTDFPHPDSAFPHATDTFLEQDFAEEAKRKILWDNPRRMYAFD